MYTHADAPSRVAIAILSGCCPAIVVVVVGGGGGSSSECRGEAIVHLELGQ